MAAEIEGALRRAGFERPAFDTIVAAGPNAALPHARAGSRRIEAGELVVLDFGGVLDGYCTDLTRTVVAGPAGTRGNGALIEQVAEAQRAAFRALVAGAVSRKPRTRPRATRWPGTDWPRRSRTARATGWDSRFTKARASRGHGPDAPSRRWRPVW